MTSTPAGAVALPPTRVTYPAGAVASEGEVLRVDDLADGTRAVVLDATACHPVDAAWPDQPADRAVLRVRGAGIEVLDCVVGAASTDPAEDATLHVGADVPVKKGADGWSFVAVHVVPGGSDVRVGDAVEVAVDPEHRRALSAGHTGCHLASLALDRALADAWTKDVPTDALGAPGFDALAIATSRIGPWSSVDTYRLGKSLRKKGFVPAALVERLDEVRAAVDATLAGWVASGAAARIEREGDLLTSRRSWVCELPGGTARIPCGGTHIAGLDELASITIDLEVEEADGAVVVRMRTTCVPACPPGRGTPVSPHLPRRVAWTGAVRPTGILGPATARRWKVVSNVAATPATKCSVCGKANPVGMATGNILDHGRNHERCPGSGKPPAVSTKPASAAAKSGTAPSRKPASDAAKREPSRKTTPAKAAGPTRGVTVRRVEVDTERLRLREEKLERIRVQREEAARRRLGDYIVPLDADGQEAPEAEITLETMDDEAQATIEPGASTESDVATADAAEGRPSA